MANKRILIVDDEDSIRFGMRDFLEARGYDVVEADTCLTAKEVFQASLPDVAILDYRLHDGNAIDLLRTFKKINPDVPLIVLTAHGSIDLAVQAVKEGAEQFLTKPIEMPSLLVVVQRLLKTRQLQRKQQAIATREDRDRIDPLFGASPVMKELAEHVAKVQGADRPILILGETGTGKSILASWLHRNGPRTEEPFVDLNCAGLTREFLEAELFGHERGAFTGAVASKQGLLEVAHGGTVFLDEIGDVDPQVQPKLLKVLEEKRFRRIGDVREREVDINLIAATHQNLAARVNEGAFRSDLYFRISSIPLTIPALRERGDDVVALARMLLSKAAVELGRGPLKLSGDAERALKEYPWPGNIRELRNVLERAALLCDENVIARHDLRFEAATQTAASNNDGQLTLQQVERRHIEQVLREERGKVERAAVRLGIPRSTLYQKIKTHGIVVSARQPA